MSYNSPTDPSTAPNYRLWKKDALIWQKLTDVPKAKQGLSLQYACKANTRIHEAVVEIDDTQVECEDGFKNVLAVLDQLFSVDVKDEEMKAYHQFETLTRKENQTVADFILEFDTVLNKIKSHGNIMSDKLLGVKLMRACNLTKFQCEIVQASTETTDYESVKATMKRTFGESTGISASNEASSSDSGNFACKNESEEGHQSMKKEEGIYHNYQNCGSSSFISGQHWKYRNPRKHQFHSQDNSVHNVILFQSDLEDPQNISKLVHETLGAAVTDCVVPRTCCGRNWLNQQMELLSPEDQAQVTYESTDNSYKFGYYPVLKASTMVRFPIYLGSRRVLLEADVLENDYPLLLSKATLKRAQSKLNTDDNEITMVGETIKLIITSTGHYAVPITLNRNVINNLSADSSANIPDKVVFMSINPKLNRNEIAEKLHQQFSHPTAERLNNLVNLSDLRHDVELKDKIKDVTENCATCKKFKPDSPNSTSSVNLQVASEFNDTLAMDIQFHQGAPILYMIDSSTRYSIAAALEDEELELCQQVINKFAELWISIFGCPRVIVSANAVISSREFIFMATSAGIHVDSSDPKGSWCSNICEQESRVLEDMITRTRNEVNCSLTVSLMWAVSSLNSMPKIQGFSPSELVFGFNVILPSVSADKPPLLSNEGYSELIRKHLQTLKISRKTAVQQKISARARRALNHVVSSSCYTSYITGDQVFYKLTSDQGYFGPGLVVGDNDQGVLIIHDGRWIRVHPHRLQLIKGDNTSLQASINNEAVGFESSDAMSEQSLSKVVPSEIKEVDGIPDVHPAVTGKDNKYSTTSAIEIVALALISQNVNLKTSYSKFRKAVILRGVVGLGNQLQCKWVVKPRLKARGSKNKGF